MSTIWEQVTAKAKLVSLPQVYIQLKSVLERPDFSMSDVAKVISQDPGITARLLRMVNSPFFGFAARIETVSRAITMLGTQQVHDLVLATTVLERFRGMSSGVMDMKLFWRRSIHCGVTARLLAYRCNVLDSERLFVAGLLHDIGHLIMYQTVPEACQQAMEESERSGRPLFLVERDLIGLDYARVGGTLMRHWSLPGSLQESTEFHVQPEKALEYPLETAIVHLAELLNRAAAAEQELDQWLPQVNGLVWQVTDLSPEQCLACQVESEAQVDEVVGLIFPEPPRRATTGG